MTQLKLVCGVVVIVLLTALPTALTTHALGLNIASLTPGTTTHNQALFQAMSFTQGKDAAHSLTRVGTLAMDVPVAQNEIPNVLVPSTMPSAEPSFPEASPTPQPTTISTNSTNATAPESAGNGMDLGKVFGSISPYFIVALIPLLFIIGALFYFFFIGDQERGAASDEKESEVQFTDASEDSGWRELK
jgi:hypothetical protein